MRCVHLLGTSQLLQPSQTEVHIIWSSLICTANFLCHTSTENPASKEMSLKETQLNHCEIVHSLKPVCLTVTDGDGDPPTPTRGLLWVCCDPLGRLGTQFGNRGVKAHLDSWFFYNLVSMEIFGLKSIQLTYKWLVCDSNDCCPCQFPCLHTNRK